MSESCGAIQPVLPWSAGVVAGDLPEIVSLSHNGRTITAFPDTGSSDRVPTNIRHSLWHAQKKRKVSHLESDNAACSKRVKKKRCGLEQQPKNMKELIKNASKDGFSLEEIAIGYDVSKKVNSNGSQSYSYSPRSEAEADKQLKYISGKYPGELKGKVFLDLEIKDIMGYSNKFKKVIYSKKEFLLDKHVIFCERLEKVGQNGLNHPLKWIHWVGDALSNNPTDKRVRLAVWWLDFSILIATADIMQQGAERNTDSIKKKSAFSWRGYIRTPSSLRPDKITGKTPLIKAIEHVYDHSSTFNVVAGVFKPNGGLFPVIKMINELSVYVESEPALARQYINLCDINDDTALHYAASKGLYYYFADLIRAGADIRQEKSTTSFHQVLTGPEKTEVKKPYSRCLQTLTSEIQEKYGYDYLKSVINQPSNITMDDGCIRQTVLHYALSERFTKRVTYSTVRTKDGTLIFNSSGTSEYGHQEAQISRCQNAVFTTVSNRAVTFDELKMIVEHLLGCGANPSIRDHAGRTAQAYVSALPYQEDKRDIIKEILFNAALECNAE